MPISYSKINRTYDEIASIISQEELHLIRVVLLCKPGTNQLTDATKIDIINKINVCNDLIEKCSEAIGRLNAATLPSGELTKRRQKWIDKKNAFEKILNELKEIRDNELNILTKNP